MITDELLTKLASGKPGSRGLAIKKFIEDPTEDRALAYDRLMKHHEEETKVLYDTIAELANQLLTFNDPWMDQPWTEAELDALIKATIGPTEPW